jgi:uncharacterized XkdX family phage protein
MYAKIKAWYDAGVWSKQWVHDAVGKGKITAAEYEEITGETYQMLEVLNSI